jgi:DNA-binding NarL/FixJ family response regulator
MKSKLIPGPQIRIATADGDPLRVLGLHTLFESAPDFVVEPVDLSKTGTIPAVDVILLRDRAGYNLADEMQRLTAALPGSRVLVTGPSLDEDAILRCLALGAKGYVSEAASSAELIKAIRIVHQGLIWASRSVLAAFIGRAASLPDARCRRTGITARQKEVLKMLVAGRSNREIAAPLGIEERTVKAHVAHLMRRLGAKNRIALSVHAVTHAIVAV